MTMVKNTRVCEVRSYFRLVYLREALNIQATNSPDRPGKNVSLSITRNGNNCKIQDLQFNHIPSCSIMNGSRLAQSIPIKVHG